MMEINLALPIDRQMEAKIKEMHRKALQGGTDISLEDFAKLMVILGIDGHIRRNLEGCGSDLK